MDYRAIFNIQRFALLGLLLMVVAILFGHRGDTFSHAKASLQADYEHAVVEANYVARFHDHTLAKMLPNVFNNEGNRYFIRYPNNWEYDASAKAIVNLNGKEGTLAYFSNINIQTIRAKKIGGLYSTVLAFRTGLKKQILQNYSNVRYVEEGPITLTQLNGTQVHGDYVVFTYNNGGLAFKQWQVIVLRNDGQVFYVWTFTSPLVQYQKNLSVAEAILKSWDIY